MVSGQEATHMMKKIFVIFALAFSTAAVTGCGVHGHVGSAHAGAGIH